MERESNMFTIEVDLLEGADKLYFHLQRKCYRSDMLPTLVLVVR